MSYRIEFDPKAIEDLKGMPSKVQLQILRKINWLGLNFEQVQPKGRVIASYLVSVVTDKMS